MQVVDTFPRPVRVVENVWIPLSDGCQLAARVWLPQDAESRPVPGILEFIPYRKRDHTRLRDEPIHHYIAGHGYAALRVDVRGSGDSDGLMADEYQQREQDDAMEVIAWIAARPWCDGNVGMRASPGVVSTPSRLPRGDPPRSRQSLPCARRTTATPTTLTTWAVA